MTLLEPALLPHLCYCVSSPADIAISDVSLVRFIGSFVKSAGSRAVQAIGPAQQLCFIHEGAERLHQRCCISSGYLPSRHLIAVAQTHPTCHICLCSPSARPHHIHILCLWLPRRPLATCFASDTHPAPSVGMDRSFKPPCTNSDSDAASFGTMTTCSQTISFISPSFSRHNRVFEPDTGTPLNVSCPASGTHDLSAFAHSSLMPPSFSATMLMRRPRRFFCIHIPASCTNCR